MYNHQLETFIRVADAGSFNKAAEESYITPTAIIKQINLIGRWTSSTAAKTPTMCCWQFRAGPMSTHC
ncbi:helix-turn-helix domain-containing protein [Faecalibacterium wellingii]|uniref:LysR family transcriptional regulator n=2 Tax=Faecalibacterium wellingii TaxID=2929491 RepID=A0ABU3TYX7_9FIRM|nr:MULTISPECIES: LysR family transcriptional regulator [Faecalibacterium]MDU8688514.1 LysR family transcriptional regulator [Faecalibacterium prausnitzii]UQK55565.1 LysR family transcriptional regulator [Faecalibacterium sp. HTF-F]